MGGGGRTLLPSAPACWFRTVFLWVGPTQGGTEWALCVPSSVNPEWKWPSIRKHPVNAPTLSAAFGPYLRGDGAVTGHHAGHLAAEGQLRSRRQVQSVWHSTLVWHSTPVPPVGSAPQLGARSCWWEPLGIGSIAACWYCWGLPLVPRWSDGSWCSSSQGKLRADSDAVRVGRKLWPQEGISRTL